jgi:hypothetical protein
MGIFNFKITPIVKEKEWDIKYPLTNRIVKICAICGYKSVGANYHMTTFTKVSQKGATKNFDTKYTCGHKWHACTEQMAKQLNVELP